MPPPATIVLAFANDWVDDKRHLRSLIGESKAIGKALAPLVDAGRLAPPTMIQNATIDEVLAAFRTPRGSDRVRIFHFGGHASGSTLLFEDTAGQPTTAHADGLATFLGQQRGLALVFLNGCSTEPQVRRLREAGVKAVVATTRAIEDTVAAELAAAFYAELATRSLREAFNAAVAAVQLRRGNDPRSVTRNAELLDDSGLPVTPTWPWIIACDPAYESWKLGAEPEPTLSVDWRPRWFAAAFVGVGALLFGLAALPLAYLLADEPHFRTAYVDAYPALFLFFAFVPLVLFALYRPTQALIGRVVVADRDRRHRRLFAFSCVMFLVGFPGYATMSELYKQWVAPWEVVRDDSFATLERFRDPRGGSSAWPAAFFVLSDRSLANDPSWGRAQLQQKYAEVFANTRLLSTKLHISRAGKAHYLAVASVAFVVAILLLNITWLLAYWRRAPASRVAPEVFRGLSAALICLVTWVLMRVSTAEVDALVFGADSVFEQLLPAVIATAAALALALLRLKDSVRSEWLATFAIVSGPATLVAAYAARATIAALFSDLRMSGACFILLLLVVVFLVGSKPNRDAAPGA